MKNVISFRRSEMLMLLDLQEVEVSFGTVKPDINSDSFSYWTGGGSFSAGTYRIKYVSGALAYANFVPPKFNLNFPDGHGFYIKHGVSELPFPAISTDSFPTQAGVEAANDGASVSFEHSGGPIGIHLIDLPYGDNFVETGSPVFELSLLETRRIEAEAEYISPLFGDAAEENDIYSGNGGGTSVL